MYDRPPSVIKVKNTTLNLTHKPIDSQCSWFNTGYIYVDQDVPVKAQQLHFRQPEVSKAPSRAALHRVNCNSLF